MATVETRARLADLLRRGRPEEVDTELAALRAAAPESADDAEPLDRAGLLAAAVAEPALRASLEGLERWLDGTVDARSAAPLGVWWALPAAELDLATVTSEARLYIDAYPTPGRVLGNVGERTASWLVQRIAMTVEVPTRIPAVRRAIEQLAQAAAPRYPVAAASLAAVASDMDDDALWYTLVAEIAAGELKRRP